MLFVFPTLQSFCEDKIEKQMWRFPREIYKIVLILILLGPYKGQKLFRSNLIFLEGKRSFPCRLKILQFNDSFLGITHKMQLKFKIIEKTKHQLYFIKISEKISHFLFLSHFQAYSLFNLCTTICTWIFYCDTRSCTLTCTHICLHPLTILSPQMPRFTSFSSTLIFFSIISLNFTIHSNS